MRTRSTIVWTRLWEAVPIMFCVWVIRIATTFIVVFGTLMAGLAEQATETLTLMAIVIGVLIWATLILEKVE